MNVLVVGCHPDDTEESCAGTIIKYAARGDSVTICHVANGNMGHVVIPPEELRLIRREEARASGRLAGAKDVVTCDIGDIMVYEGIKEQRDAMVDVIRAAQPDVIFTQCPEDYMSDHTAVSRLVFDASFAASVPHYKTKINETARVTPIFYMEPQGAPAFSPTHYVDISDVIDTKLKMIECHESQVKWLREHDGIDYPEWVRTLSRFRGLQCGVTYAEAFMQCNAYLRLTTKRLLP